MRPEQHHWLHHRCLFRCFRLHPRRRHQSARRPRGVSSRQANGPRGTQWAPRLESSQLKQSSSRLQPPPGLGLLSVRSPYLRHHHPYLLRGLSAAAPLRLCASALALVPSHSLLRAWPQRRPPPPMGGPPLAYEAAWRTGPALQGRCLAAVGRPRRRGGPGRGQLQRPRPRALPWPRRRPPPPIAGAAVG